MAWYNNIFGTKPVEEKLNPAQRYIGNEKESSREPVFSYEQYYEAFRNCKSWCKYDRR